jgi:hypothetical protein
MSLFQQASAEIVKKLVRMSAFSSDKTGEPAATAAFEDE